MSDFLPNCTVVDGEKRIRARLGKMSSDHMAYIAVEFLAADIAYRTHVSENVTYVHILVPPCTIIPDDTVHEIIVWTIQEGKTIEDYHEQAFPVEDFQWYREAGAR